MALRTIFTLIGVGGITADYIGADAVDGSKIADDAIDSEHVAAGALDSEHYATGSVGADAIDDTVENKSLYYAVVTAASIANLANIVDGAPQSLDGKVLGLDADVLLMEQTDASENGIYNVDVVGTSDDGEWSRATERDAAAELPVGLLVYVINGDVNGGKMFRLVDFGGTLETDDIEFAEVTKGMTPSTSSGEMEDVGTGDGETLTFDLDNPDTAFIAVFVDGVQQDPATFSVSVETGGGGVDQLVFGEGNAPADSASIEAIVLIRG